MLADVRFEPLGARMVARLSGEVDMSNAEDVGRAIRRMLTNETLGIVLDLSSVDYLDSAGIHLIYALREDLSVRGQRVILVVPEACAARDTLRLAAVLHTLESHTTVDGALAELDNGG